MADTKISALTAVTTPATTDQLPVNQGGTSKRLTSLQLATFVTGAYNVKHYGALGDGSTDDTAALMALKTTAGANAEIYMPAGTYIVNGFQLDVAGQTWRLHPGAVLKVKNGATVDNYIAAAGVRLIGGEWNGNRANVSAVGSGLWITSAGTRAQVREMYIHNTLNRCIETNADFSKIVDCRISDSDGAGIVAQTNIDFVEISGNTVDTIPTGISIAVKGENPSLAIGTKIIGNHVNPGQRTDICIEVFGLSHNSIIANNTTVDGSMGVSVDASYYTTVIGNTFITPRQNGVELAGTNHCTVVGNTVQGGGSGGTDNGVAISSPSASSQYNAITGNNFYNTSRGVKCVAVSDHTTITGNVIDQGAAWVYGIELGASAGAVVTGNTIRGGGTASGTGVYMNNSDDVLVSGNLIENYQLGVSLDPAADNSLVVGNKFKTVTTEFSSSGINNQAWVNYPGANDSPIVGTSKVPPRSFTLLTDREFIVYNRLGLGAGVRATLQGNSDVIVSDDFRARSRIVLAGRG